MSGRTIRTGWFPRLWCAWLTVLCAAAGPCIVQAAPSPEAQVKAAIVFNLLRFVDWPGVGEDSVHVVRLGVVGEGGVADALLALEGKMSGSITFNVRRVLPGDGPQGFEALFFAGVPKEQQADYMRALANDPVLTFGETAGFLDSGGMVQLGLREERVHIRLALERVKASRLRIPAQVLKLVEIVHTR